MQYYDNELDDEDEDDGIVIRCKCNPAAEPEAELDPCPPW
jgi:hypothetical protein